MALPHNQYNMNMEDNKRKDQADRRESDIIFSKSIKAGKRIYYLDVKKNRKEELFLAITESKKIVKGVGEDSNFQFEKHKIFLYKEDFDKFTDGLTEVLDFIRHENFGLEAEHDATDATVESDCETR